MSETPTMSAQVLSTPVEEGSDEYNAFAILLESFRKVDELGEPIKKFRVHPYSALAGDDAASSYETLSSQVETNIQDAIDNVRALSALMIDAHMLPAFAHFGLLRNALKMVGTGCWVLGAGCWVLGAGFWVLGSGFWVLGSGFWVLGSGFWVLGSGFWVLGSGFWVLDSGFWILDSGFWVLGSGFWVLGPSSRDSRVLRSLQAATEGRRDAVTTSNELARFSTKFPEDDPVRIILESQRDVRPGLVGRSLQPTSISKRLATAQEHCSDQPYTILAFWS